MHNPESVMENKTQHILLDFEIETDHLIPRDSPQKKIYRIVDFPVPADHRVQIKVKENRD